MTRYRPDAVCPKANNWASLNVTRYQNPDYDALHDQARIEMNDLSVDDVVEIPLVLTGGGPAATINLISNYHDIADWRMDEQNRRREDRVGPLPDPRVPCRWSMLDAEPTTTHVE